jgi:hypothetical protein
VAGSVQDVLEGLSRLWYGAQLVRAPMHDAEIPGSWLGRYPGAAHACLRPSPVPRTVGPSSLVPVDRVITEPYGHDVCWLVTSYRKCVESRGQKVLTVSLEILDIVLRNIGQYKRTIKEP